MSFAKPRPGGNRAYLGHILEVGHGSVLEHAVFNFIITGVSRSFTHELIRHRAGSGTRNCQRYVDESDMRVRRARRDRRGPRASRACGWTPSRPPGGLSTGWRTACGEVRRHRGPDPAAQARAPGRPLACCRTPPRPRSSSPANARACGTSSRCAAPSRRRRDPQGRRRACWRSSRRARTCSATTRSTTCPSAAAASTAHRKV